MHLRDPGLLNNVLHGEALLLFLIEKVPFGIPSIDNYRITRIVARSDWPRGVYVNLVVTPRCFSFRVLITQARI